MKTDEAEQPGKDYTVISLSLHNDCWDWIEEKRELMKMGRTEFVQYLIADIAGITHLKQPPATMSDITKGKS